MGYDSVAPQRPDRVTLRKTRILKHIWRVM